uniref:VAN3-binding protein-like auxin canalisation domain-containing protein n=1 Tax=Zea mays TaxID=4577 RepID=A0A804LQK8_MAIZE
MTDAGAARARRPGGGGDGDLPLRPPEPPRDPLEFLSRSWSVSSSAADDVSRALAPALASGAAIAEDVAGELDAASGSSFSFASAATSQLVLDRIMAPTSVEVAPLTSGRLSHSSGPLNCGGSLSDSPPVSPEIDDTKGKFCRMARYFSLVLQSGESEHAEAAAVRPRREQDGGAVAQGPQGEEEGGGAGAQRAGARRRLRGGRGRGHRRSGGGQGCAHGHGGGVGRDAGGRAVRGGRGGPGRRARAAGGRRGVGRQRQDP